MKTTKQIKLSICCNAATVFLPPCLGDPGVWICDKCSSETEVYAKKVKTHDKIEEGVYRPV